MDNFQSVYGIEYNTKKIYGNKTYRMNHCQRGASYGHISHTLFEYHQKHSELKKSGK